MGSVSSLLISTTERTSPTSSGRSRHQSKYSHFSRMGFERVPISQNSPPEKAAGGSWFIPAVSVSILRPLLASRIKKKEPMAESAVKFLLEKLADLIIPEASLLRGARQDLEKIKLELESMQAFLRDADRRKDSNEELKTWVKQVREAAYDVEAILDEFLQHSYAPVSKGFRSLIDTTIRLPKNLFHKYQFVTRLQEINEKICEISARRNRYTLNQIEEGASLQDGSEGWQRSIETAIFKEEDGIVGMRKEFDLIVQWLLEGDERLTVISVTGMGGLGKTTLVSKAFKYSEVRKAFHCFAYVSVSQTLRITDLLRRITKQLLESNMEVAPDHLAAMDIIDLRKFLVHHLQSKRYVIVLDDIWSVKDWEDINSVFPDHHCGSRLMVTTRNVEVAQAMGGGSLICALQPLNQEDAWELFNNKAFRNETCPTDLESVARSMVEKCEGLPLAIIAMGGLLLTKERNMVEWNKVYSSLNWQLSNNPMFLSLYNILLLSFHHLPYYLKHCFLYCSMFPEDYPIKRKQLIKLWVAEGFVKERGGMTMEEVAEEYLKELIHRNMLHVAMVNYFGRVKVCRMHDMMREVAISLSRNEDFSITCDAQDAGKLYKFRCISIYDDRREIIQAGMNSSRVHSVIIFNNKKTPIFDSLHKVVSSFQLLRVLYLKGARIDRVPDELVELFNLRYLNLAKTGISELPESFEKLINLQTLDLRGTKVERLPVGIGKLQKLRHLVCYPTTDSVYKSFHAWKFSKFPPQLCSITSLQSLQTIPAEGETVREIGNLTQLRSLVIAKVRASDGVELCGSIGKMRKLARLGIIGISEEETLELEALSPSPPPLLQKLYLMGHLEKVPQWLASLTNLACLALHWSGLREEEGDGLLLILQALPNLVKLYLRKPFHGQQLALFKEGWFPKLKQLCLVDVTELRLVVIEKGAMPSLRKLTLLDCRELKVVPHGIEHLPTLQELHLLEMPQELVNRLRGEDCGKVASIPIIRRGCKSDGQWKVENLK
ncbi:hypothetical protein ACLOJK_015898 [Asimina triloba]